MSSPATATALKLAGKPIPMTYPVGICAHGYRAYALVNSGRAHSGLWHTGPPITRTTDTATREDGIVLAPCEVLGGR